MTAAWLATLCLAACGGGGGAHADDVAGDDMPGDDQPSDGRVVVAESNYIVNRSLDLLLVIDDSPSMIDKQGSFADSLPELINILNTLPGGFPDIHIGVVSTDLGTKAAADPAPGPTVGSGPGACSGSGKGGNLQLNGATVQGAFVSDIKQIDGTRTKNYTGDLASTLSTMVKLGANGCGFEQPLAAMHAALANNATNAGFLRPDANLAVLVLSDEDDCSVEHAALFGPPGTTLGDLMSFRCTRFGVTCSSAGESADSMNTVGSKSGCAPATDASYVSRVSTYVDFLKGVKAAGDKQISVSILAGPTTPFSVELRTAPGTSMNEPALAHSCAYQGAMGTEVADPAVRLAAFAKSFANNSVGSVCGDLADSLVAAGRTIKFLVGTTCIDEPLAGTAPAYDCIVEDLTAAGVATTLPNCSAGAKPCWKIESDLVNCPTDEHLSVKIDRDDVPAPGASFRARCTVAP
jgi:hypothetical protein